MSEEVPELIQKEWPQMTALLEKDIRFSDVLPHVRCEIAKSLAVLGEQSWQELAARLGMKAEDIAYAAQLRAHSGCPVLNMFDIYIQQYGNSLAEIVRVLSKLKNKRTLTKISEHWTDIQKAQQQISRSAREPDLQSMSLPSSTDPSGTVDMRLNQHQINPNFSMPPQHFPASALPLSPAAFPSQNANYTPVKQHQTLTTREVKTQFILPQQHFSTHGLVKSYQHGDDRQMIMAKHNRTKEWVEKTTSLTTSTIIPLSGEFQQQEEEGFNNCQTDSVFTKYHLADTNHDSKPQNSYEINVQQETTSGFTNPPVNGMTMAVAGPARGSTDIKKEQLPSFTESFIPATQPSISQTSCELSDQIKHEKMECDPVTNGMKLENTTVLHNTSQYLTIPITRSAMRKRNCGESVVDTLRKSPSCTGKVETAQFSDSLRNVSVFITHLFKDPGGRIELQKYNNKCVISLGRCLKDNSFRVQMDVPEKNKVPGNGDWRNWIDSKFMGSHFIIVCITPQYLDVVNSTEIEDNDWIEDNVQSTRYIYHLMQHEYEENNNINSRFIPVVFCNPHSQGPEFLPQFLQGCGLMPYWWPKEYLDLLWRLDRHDLHLNHFS